jgi:hypothetical protein
MILELSPGAIVTVSGQRYTVEEHTAFHDTDFRMDLTRLVGPTPAHERWVLTIQNEQHPILLQPLTAEWLETPPVSVIHDGEMYAPLYKGSAHRVWHARAGRGKEARSDYSIYRADSGKVVLIISGTDSVSAWSGATIPASAIGTPKR